MVIEEDIFRFHQAVIDNDHAAVQEYLDHGGGINVKSPDQAANTALHWAAQEGHTDMIRLLLKKGADPNVSSGGRKGSSPLDICAAHNKVDVARALLEAKADPNICNKYGWTALHNASDYGHLEMVKMLLEHGAKIEARNERKCTPLHCAALKCQTHVVLELLNRGANVNATGLLGTTPLWFASKFAPRHGNAEELCTIIRKNGGLSHPVRVALEGAVRQVLRLLFLLVPLLVAWALGVAIPSWGVALYLFGVVVVFLTWGQMETIG